MALVVSTLSPPSPSTLPGSLSLSHTHWPRGPHQQPRATYVLQDTLRHLCLCSPDVLAVELLVSFPVWGGGGSQPPADKVPSPCTRPPRSGGHGLLGGPEAEETSRCPVGRSLSRLDFLLHRCNFCFWSSCICSSRFHQQVGDFSTSPLKTIRGHA